MRVTKVHTIISILSFAALAICLVVRDTWVSFALIVACLLIALALLGGNISHLANIVEDNPKVKTIKFVTVFNAVECSVLGLNYNESKGAGGLFRDKIVGTNTYKNYINKIKKGTYSTGVGYVLTHPKSENADLYYSLHSCTYTTTKSGSTYKVAVYDYYDFALMNYNSLFTGIVNNWAWLCQHTGVLHKIHVNISFSA